MLLVSDGKNRGEWTKEKVLKYIRGKDGVVRGVVLLHKGHNIQRPLTLVCPLEIKAVEAVQEEPVRNESEQRPRSTRKAAEQARERIRLVANQVD